MVWIMADKQAGLGDECCSLSDLGDECCSFSEGFSLCLVFQLFDHVVKSINAAALPMYSSAARPSRSMRQLGDSGTDADHRVGAGPRRCTVASVTPDDRISI